MAHGQIQLLLLLLILLLLLVVVVVVVVVDFIIFKKEIVTGKSPLITLSPKWIVKTPGESKLFGHDTFNLILNIFFTWILRILRNM